MFKKMTVLIVAFSVLLGGICMADKAGPLPASEASLGGITLGSPMSYVHGIYGAPTDRYITMGKFNTQAIGNLYGKGFYVIEYASQPAVLELYTDANNGIATPMGITVGVPKSSVDRLYGGGSYYKGDYYYRTQNALDIQIKYGHDANGVTVVKSIYIHFQS